jgi:hypothetical protein
MKTTNKVLTVLLTVAMLICSVGLPAHAAESTAAITFRRTTDMELPAGYYIVREAITTPVGTAVTYQSSDPAVATVNATGKVVGVKPGKAVITASTGNLSASFNVTVTPAPAVAPSNTTVFEGYNVTILDKTTPAVNVRGRTDDRNVMCFVAADDREIGVITYSDYRAIIDKNKKMIVYPDGSSLGVPPDGSSNWNEWFADHFNKLRGLDSGSRVVAVETQTAETVEAYRQELIRLVNIERENAGLSPYIVHDVCMEYSQLRAAELVTLFSHSRPDGTNAGYEIISAKALTPSGVVKAWMESTGHRAAILNENRLYVGAGCHITSNGTMFWQMYFERDPEVYANTFLLG